MSVYLIADIEVHDAEQYREYVERAPAFIEKYGGHYRVRGGEARSVEGEWEPHRIVVLEFPSAEKADGFLSDPGYREVAAIRHAASTSRMIRVEGL